MLAFVLPLQETLPKTSYFLDQQRPTSNLLAAEPRHTAELTTHDGIINMSSTVYSTDAEFNDAYSTLHKTFATGRTKSIKWRKWQLKQVWWMLEQNQQRWIDALHQDLNRHPFETLGLEFRAVKSDIVEFLEHVDEWAQGEDPKAGFIMGTLGKAWLRKEPLGVALIIGTWNFPLFTLLSPALAAIVAGKSSHSVPPSRTIDGVETSQSILVEQIKATN